MTLSTSSLPVPAPFAPIPLWRQLQSTATVLVAIRAGQSATTALNDVETSLRPGVQALVFHVLRGLGQAEALRRKLANRTPPPPVDALLCIALALGWREERAEEGGLFYDSFTLVDQAVEAAKRNTTATGHAAGRCAGSGGDRSLVEQCIEEAVVVTPAIVRDGLGVCPTLGKQMAG